MYARGITLVNLVTLVNALAVGGSKFAEAFRSTCLHTLGSDAWARKRSWI